MGKSEVMAFGGVPGADGVRIFGSWVELCRLA